MASASDCLGRDLGAIGDFIWAVQSGMMPVSFGRQPLSRPAVLVPALAYNSGAGLALLAAVGLYSDQVRSGELQTG